MQIRTIVVATDLSSFAVTTHRHAGGLARSVGARITLLHVDELTGFPASYMSEMVQSQIEQQRRMLVGEAARALAEVAPTEVVRRVGDPASQICEHLHDHDADLLVLGKRSHLGLRRLLLGRTVKRVLRRIEIPTLVVPHAEEEARGFVAYKRILVGTDLSRNSFKGMRAALALAERIDATLECLHVIRMPVLGFMGPEWPMVAPAEIQQELGASLADRLAAQVNALGSGRCRGNVSLGHRVSAALADAAGGGMADLIVLAAHGESGDRRYVGTTTENLLKLAHVPVLVFPSPYLARIYPDR